MTKNNEKKYTESIFYETFLTGKYIKKMGEQLFCKLKLDFTVEEFSAMDFLYGNSDICQRDLAVKMLIDRANMGKILNNLEKRGYIKRTLTIKSNRPAKIVHLTDKGIQVYADTIQELRKISHDAISKITSDEIEIISNGLLKIRNILSNILTINI